MDKIFEIESLETFNNVIEDILLNLYVSKQISNIHMDPYIIQAAKEDMKKLIENSNLESNTISKQLLKKGWREDKVNSLVSLIERKKTELLFASILNYNSKYGQVVQNLDWALKLVNGTNDLKTLNYPLLQLELYLQNSAGMPKQYLYDVNKEMLCKLISILDSKNSL